MPKQTVRFGIGEWYGKSFVTIPNDERRKFAEIQNIPKKLRQKMKCPFKSITKDSFCTKEGGVCSLRKYSIRGEGKEIFFDRNDLSTTCPYRFQENVEIFKWVGETILDCRNPSIVTEVGFLEKPSDMEAEQGGDDVGRIDMVLVHHPLDDAPLHWCALEIQAVYFSGDSMKKDFLEIEKSDEKLPFPAGKRRPDYRSSGPKRLMPQLQIKVPTLRRWGKKMAVVVDRNFFNSLGAMDDVKDISNCDIAWFVMKYIEEEGKPACLARDFVRFTTLERAVEGLTGGVPVNLAEFETRIRRKLYS